MSDIYQTRATIHHLIRTGQFNLNEQFSLFCTKSHNGTANYVCRYEYFLNSDKPLISVFILLNMICSFRISYLPYQTGTSIEAI